MKYWISRLALVLVSVLSVGWVAPALADCPVPVVVHGLLRRDQKRADAYKSAIKATTSCREAARIATECSDSAKPVFLPLFREAQLVCNRAVLKDVYHNNPRSPAYGAFLAESTACTEELDSPFERAGCGLALAQKKLRDNGVMSEAEHLGVQDTADHEE